MKGIFIERNRVVTKDSKILLKQVLLLSTLSRTSMSEDEKRSRKCWQISSLHVMGLVIEQKDPMRCVPAAAIISLRPHAEPGHGAIAAVRPDLIWITLALHWGDTGGHT